MIKKLAVPFLTLAMATFGCSSTTTPTTGGGGAGGTSTGGAAGGDARANAVGEPVLTVRDLKVHFRVPRGAYPLRMQFGFGAGCARRN